MYAFQHAAGNPPVRAAAQTTFGDALNQLTVRLSRDAQPVLDVLLAMFVMMQAPRPGVENVVGEAMQVLTLWERGDIMTAHIIAEFEHRAGVKFSKDRRSVNPA